MRLEKCKWSHFLCFFFKGGWCEPLATLTIDSSSSNKKATMRSATPSSISVSKDGVNEQQQHQQQQHMFLVHAPADNGDALALLELLDVSRVQVSSTTVVKSTVDALRELVCGVNVNVSKI